MARLHEEVLSDGSITDHVNVYGYIAAQLLTHVLKQCGDNLPANVMKQVQLTDVSFHCSCPASRLIRLFRFFPIQQLRLAKFDGAVGPVWEVINN
jgi:hypothetical protein